MALALRANLSSPHEPAKLHAPAKSVRSDAARPAPRAGRQPGHGHRRRHHHRQRHLPRPPRDDAGCRLLGAGLSRLDRRRAALALRSHDLRRAGRHAALRRRRICVPARRLRRLDRLPLYVDLVRRRQACLHRRRYHRPGPHARLLPCFPLAQREHPRSHPAGLVTAVRHRRHLVHHRAQLPGHQEGRRLPAVLHHAQGRAHPHRRRPLLCGDVGLTRELHHHAAPRRGRLQTASWRR